MVSFLKEVAEDLVARTGKDLHHAAVVFNNKRPVAYLQNHLAQTIGKPFWSPSFFTIQEFFALSTDLQVADGFTQFFTLYHQYNELLKKEGTKAINPDVFYPIARIILSDFAQIDNDLVNAGQLFEELKDIAVIEKNFQHLSPEQQSFLEQFWTSFSLGKQKNHQEQFIRMWRRMPALYNGFHEALEEKGLTSMAHVYRKLAFGQEEKPDFIDAFAKGKLAFAGFNALSNAEAMIFKRWSQDEKALFYFDTDNYYMQDETQEAGLFLRKNIQKLGLPNALGESRDLIRAVQKEIRVYKTQGQTAQAKILQQELEEDYPMLDAADNAGKIALILADESLLLPVLQTIPTSYHAESAVNNHQYSLIPGNEQGTTAEHEKRKAVNLNVTMGYPLLATSIFGLADIWLSVQSQLSGGKKDTVHYREVEAFLSHPLVGLPAGLRNELQKKILDGIFVEIEMEVLKEAGELSGLFFKRRNTGVAAISGLLEVFTLILRQQIAEKTLKQTEADLFIAIIKELNRLHDTLTEYTNELPLPFVLSLMQKAIQGIAVPLSGEPLEGVQVMGLLESRSLDFDHVYILGVNEGILPQVSVSPSFIPDSIRRAYGLPVIENQDAISAYMFYRLLQRSRKVSLVYNGQGDENNTGEPSRFLRQLEFESGYTFKYFDQSQTIATSHHTKTDIKKEGEILTRLHQYLDQQDPFLRISATALTTYMNCPVQFFYKYIAKIEEPKELSENLEANNIGSMLHFVMERFYEELKADEPYITRERIAEHRKQLDRLGKIAFAKIMADNEHQQVNHNGMQQVVLAIVAEYANVILNYDETEAPFSVLDLESKDQINFKIDVNGMERSLTLHGIIDRVDLKKGITRVVDYKTGRDELSYSSLSDLFDADSGKQNKALIQTLFYTYIYEQAKGITGMEPNLYLIRKMRKEGTLFYSGGFTKGLRLQVEHLAGQKAEFIVLLKSKLEELFNPELPFIHTTQADNCKYCPYLSLCGK
ncbi:Exodeoxyribonuclease V, gamma subunit [Pedobacter westerhofensis]|uniref:Exodeoxyribonuclease V, gamma subunit n=1 Tax=Pedobacter westerhofensis TaxID=425512 RepID=A0A521DZC0_9SPHI|nr:PD-(D/E)XK nuclease family protein [Pedobacter westerhofensis]SMO76988.1 Exodeoxyribonuclease V, gamma subunit [Pedobacter westerhofensis]